jgi:hypothetical protein
MLSLQSKVHPAMMINIKADALYTIMDTEFWAPLKMVINNTSKPMKHSVRPSAAHSIVYLLEHLLADYVAVIVGPPSEKRVEFFYQLSGEAQGLVLMQYCPDTE